MKIFHISDVHGDELMLEHAVEAADKLKPDVVVCSGDIAGQCLPDKEVRILEKSFYELIKNRRIDLNRVNGSFREAVEDFREYVRFMAGADFEPAEDYSRLEAKFGKEAERQYENLLAIFARFKQPVLTVPGNWDSDKYLELFAKFDIHKKMREVDGICFAGYGSTFERMPFVPVTRIIPYSEGDLQEFLTREEVLMDANAFVTHITPSGVQDYEDNPGSEALKTAMEESCPDLVLCGHAHFGLGHKNLEGRTVVVNPGNLGEYRGRPGKGTLALIEYDQVVDNTQVDHFVIGNDNEEYTRAIKEGAVLSA